MRPYAAAPGRSGALGARACLPMAVVLSLPNRKYLLIRRISMGAAPVATRLLRLFGTSRAREFRAALKVKNRFRQPKTPQRRRLFGRIDRTIGVVGPPATHAHG